MLCPSVFYVSPACSVCWNIRLSGTLQSVTGVFPEKGMSGSDLRESHHSETVGILKQLMDDSRVDLQTLEMLPSSSRQKMLNS